MPYSESQVGAYPEVACTFALSPALFSTELPRPLVSTDAFTLDKLIATSNAAYEWVNLCCVCMMELRIDYRHAELVEHRKRLCLFSHNQGKIDADLINRSNSNLPIICKRISYIWNCSHTIHTLGDWRNSFNLSFNVMLLSLWLAIHTELMSIRWCMCIRLKVSPRLPQLLFVCKP